MNTQVQLAIAVVRAIEIARANACAAIDQKAEYDDSVSAYAQNVRDSLDEEGLSAHQREAMKAYYLRVAELL